jgi:predicted amino acid-binding ACT domain protein
MQTHLVLTVIGRDRLGLVGLVSAMIADGGGTDADEKWDART